MDQHASAGRLLIVAGALAALALASGAGAAEYRYRIEWATYVGGGADEQLREVIPCEDGSILMGGQTSSPDLPATPGAVQATYGEEPAGTGHSGLFGGDCFLIRLGRDGRRALQATYFGGSKQERNVYGMALDSRGDVVLTTTSRSPDLPTTDGAFQTKYAGGPSDWVVAKLSADLKRVLWCTYVGGSDDESPRGGLAIDKEDCVYVVGGTASPNFPTTASVCQRQRKGSRDAAIVKLKADGSGLVFATLLGGSDWDGTLGVRVDGGGNVHVAGHTRSADFPVTPGAAQGTYTGESACYLAGLAPDASRILYATFLAGSRNEFAEHRPALLDDGSHLLTGVTASPDFPTTPGAFQRERKGRTDGFLTRLSKDGKQFTFSTLVGGSQGEFFLMPTPDKRGNILFVGTTESKDFPVTPNALQATYGGGGSDGVLAVLSPDGRRLLFATYLGGNGDDLVRSLAITAKGEVLLVGSTSSPDLPVTAGAYQGKLRGKTDAFVVKLVPAE